MSVLATETLIQIFEHLDNPRDLFHVVQTCLVFHGIAIELLYRHIQYRSLKSFNAQTARWKNAQDGLYSFPQSVVLHDVLRVPQGARWMWNDHYKGTEALQVQPQIDLWVRLLSFTFLHTLSISHCLLPDSESFSYLLQGCQSLRKLSIETCSFQRKPRGFSVSYGLFPWLPLEELSLLGENTVTDYRWPYRPPSDAEAGSFLHLLTVRSIRTLNIDLDYQNCAFLASRTSSNVISFGNLERLRLRISKRCAEGNIPAFLNAHCASVKTLELLDFADLPSDHLRLRPGALRHLTNYKGPAALAPAVAAAGCPLGRLETSDLMMSVSQASKVLGEVGGHRPQLEALDITIQEWDVEILYAISYLFRHIREVKIKYHSGCPDEPTIVSMASIFFDEMKNITTLHIYNPHTNLAQGSYGGYIDLDRASLPYNLGPSGSDEVLKLMAGWIEACPTLTEVKWKKESLLCRKSTRKEDKWFFTIDSQPVEVNTQQQRR